MQFNFKVEKKEDKPKPAQATEKAAIVAPSQIVTKIEKDEKEVFRQKAKTYRFDASEWKERGEGDIVIAESDKHKRVVMHRDLTGKCAINFIINSDIQIANMANNVKAVTVTCVDYSDGEAKPSVLAFKFKEEEKANQYKKMLTELKEQFKCSTKETEEVEKK
uniref:RAN binding protein 1 n=1 Tax=Trepomonas sp. PC1 TaxID=1076344 RepID=A0A146KA24_9EUKA|eukprot:JAP92356.1 RAN binding protein 1 [Trepomonas sp. PC1]